MKKHIIIITTAFTLAAGACHTAPEKSSATKTVDKPKGKYYCTMHPEITSDKPGVCSKCGMELVARDTTK